jgi:hypothetical protein
MAEDYTQGLGCYSNSTMAFGKPVLYRVYLGHFETAVFDPKHVPNRFHRWMQKTFLGITWVKVSQDAGTS